MFYQSGTRECDFNGKDSTMLSQRKDIKERLVLELCERKGTEYSKLNEVLWEPGWQHIATG